MGIVAVVACAILTIAYLCWADVAVGWKAIMALLYAVSWFIDRFIHLPVPTGLFMQIVLSIYYILYFKVKGS